MAPKTLRRAGLRVSYPDTHTASRRAPTADRLLGPGDPHALLLEALRDNDFEAVDEIRLSPRRPRSLPDPAAEPGRLHLEVDLDGEQDAVVLVEQGGCYSWHLPGSAVVADGRRTRRLPGQAHTASFDVDLVAVRGTGTRVRHRDLDPAEPRTRGMFGDLLAGALRAVVLKFAAPLLVGQAISFLERHVEPGLIHITDPDPSTWRRVERLEEVGLPIGRPARVLLFVHGTFSTTLSAFVSLGLVGDGPRFLRAALAHYDAVVGFDHPTLSVDPLANATDLLRRVSSVSSGVTFDVVTHSRGGLTTRSFVEYVLPGSGWPGSVDKVVFVAATNAGTHLADPHRWYELIDLTTNLVMVTTGALASLPGAAPLAGVVGGVVKGLGALVKYLGSYALEDGGVPGLAAMQPGGPFVTAINQTQPGQPGPGTAWFVGKSDFHVSLLQDGHRPEQFPRELALRLAEGLVDQIFHGPNDLVVDSASMGSIDTAVGGFVRDTYDFGSNDIVHHLNYFDQTGFVEALADWLLTSRVRHREVSAEPPAEAGGEPEDPMPTGGETAPPTKAAEPTGSAGPVRAHLRGELPAAPVAGARALLRIALSRKKIKATVGASGAAATLVAQPGRILTVQVVPKRNVSIHGPDTDSFSLPPGNGTSELQFQVVPTAPGTATVGVIVRDGAVPVGMLTVTTKAVKKAPARPRADRAPTVAAVGRVTTGGRAPRLEDLLCLDVVEEVQGAGPGAPTVLHYTVRHGADGLLERYTSAPLRDREGYVSELYRDLARAFADHGASPAYTAALQDRGAQLFDELFPEPMRRLLWSRRKSLGPLVLTSDEPYLPWELVHLKPVSGARPKTPMFLGQLGLIRWEYTDYPTAELRARTGRVWVLCPDYVDPVYQLTQPAEEADFLRDRLGARTAKGSSGDVAALLRKGGFDVLHFSGHGVADPTDAAAAKLLLAGKLVRGKVSQDYLSATTVAQNTARLRARDGSGPLVVLNACQLARGGRQLSTLGGFAHAFLEAGAAAYVSTLWSVGQLPAQTFVEALYDRLLAGATIAEAAAAAREAARKGGDATWLAYAVYARPDARLVTA